MKQAPVNSLLELICHHPSLAADDKDCMISSVRGIEKLIHNLEFKIERLNDVKDTLTIMLEESVSELERKSAVVSSVNEELTRALGELKTYAEELDEQKKQVELEKSKSDKLLLNILPQQVVSELKTYGRSYARQYEQVSVLFADIEGFSTLAASLLPDELVAHLDDYFRGFDHIIEKYGIEKIKTIGDSYMCVSGLFGNEKDHAMHAVSAARDMQQFISSVGASKKIQGLPVFKFRIGIHSGPLVAGVIGFKKFAFDVWGDTVNMAARMEQHGAADKINISRDTYGLVKDHFTCCSRGIVSLKNGRQIEMYFVQDESCPASQ